MDNRWDYDEMMESFVPNGVWYSPLLHKEVPAVSIIRDVMTRLETELHLAMGGLPSGTGPLRSPSPPDERPALVIKKGKR